MVSKGRWFNDSKWFVWRTWQINDEIYYFSYDWKVDAINSLSIEYDLDWEGRYIILK